MILVNIYKSYKVSPEYIRKVLSISNPYYTQKMKYLTIDENYIFRLTLDLSMFPITISHISNYLFIGVIMGGFLVNMLLSSIYTHIIM